MTSYQRLKKELELERKANERARLQLVVMAKAIVDCGGTMSRPANSMARRVLGLKRSHKKIHHPIALAS